MNDPVDVLIIGAGASGAAVAWSLADTKMHILCLEQGAWMNPATYPSTPKEVFEAAVLGEQRTLHIEEDVPSVRTWQAGKALPSTNGSVST